MDERVSRVLWFITGAWLRAPETTVTDELKSNTWNNFKYVNYSSFVLNSHVNFTIYLIYKKPTVFKPSQGNLNLQV